MKERLGDQYQTSFAISARPALLALLKEDADKPEKLQKDQEKFLKRISQEDLLKFSHIENLVQLIIDESPSEKEILETNRKKFAVPFAQCAEEIHQNTQELSEFTKHSYEMQTTLGNECRDILKSLEHHFEDFKDTAKIIFKTELRAECYEIAKQDLDKIAFTAALQQTLKKASNNIQFQFTQEVRDLTQEMNDRLKRTLKKIQFEVNSHSLLKISDLNIVFQNMMDAQVEENEVEWVSLTTSIIGAGIALIIGGPLTIAAGIATGFWGIWKSFSGPSLEERRKQAINKAIKDLDKKFSQEFNESLEQIEKETKKQVKDMIDKINIILQ